MVLIALAAGCAAGPIAAALAQVPPTTAAKRPASPAPRSTSTAEAEHRQHIDAILAPVVGHTIASGDTDRLKQAFTAIGAGDSTKAYALRDAIGDATAKKLVSWYALTHGFGAAADYRDFLARNPTWPQRRLLQQRLEENLFTRGGGAEDIVAHFKNAEPATAVGQAALASAYLAQGNRDKARATAAKVWREGDLPAALETGFLERFGALLTAADHRWRLDRYLMGDRRWQDGRAAQAA
jgi:soluble lytic murein transglycosylase